MFITQADLQLIRPESVIIALGATSAQTDTFIETAIEMVKAHLGGLYDTVAIFNATGAARQPLVVRMCSTVALYYMFERLNTNQVPESIKDSYKGVVTTLNSIATGTLTLSAPKLITDTGSATTFITSTKRPNFY